MSTAQKVLTAIAVVASLVLLDQGLKVLGSGAGMLPNFWLVVVTGAALVAILVALLIYAARKISKS